MLKDTEREDRMLIMPRKIKWGEGAAGFGKARVTGADPKAFRYLIGLCGAKEGVRAPETGGVKSVVFGEATALTPEYAGPEAYAMSAEPGGVAVSARTEAGLANGLKAYARMRAELGEVPCCTVQDAPAFPFRGVHLCVFDPLDGTEKEDTSPAAIKRMLAAAALSGYNTVFLEFWGMFPYARNPYACWPHSEYDGETVKRLISYAIDDLHLTPCPCQNLVSHAGWSRINSRRHVVLDRRKDLAEMWIPGGWCFATENTKTKRFLTDVMEELLAAYRNPPLFHVSADKCFGFGSSEEDRTKPADVLFANHLCFLNTFLQERGTRMTMWGDMLYSATDSLYWKADSRLADYLPKNILVNVWTHNAVGMRWPDAEFFESRGFDTVYSPFLNRAGIEGMNAICAQGKSLGILQTTWYQPQTAAPAVAYNAGLSWSGGTRAPKEEAVSAFLAKWYEVEV